MRDNLGDGSANMSISGGARDNTAPRLSRRAFLASGAVGVAVGLSIGYLLSRRYQPPPAPSTPSPPLPTGEALSSEMLDKLAASIWPVLRKDSIPAIDQPKFISANEADQFLSADEYVFGLSYKGTHRAYPQLVLYWHEIVNDIIQGERITVTYCPLTASTRGFRGHSSPEGTPPSFGTSGSLLNSNLVMYDRETGSRWPQILGVAVDGPHKGHALEDLPVVWTTWGQWKRLYPDTEVLSSDTGFERPYGEDSFAWYTTQNPRSYYNDPRIAYPVLQTDKRFHPKRIVTGVMHRGAYLALPKEEFARVGVANLYLGDEPIVALYDARLDTVRVFVRRIDDTELTFELVDDVVRDRSAGAEWSPQGKALSGPFDGRTLPRITAFDVMWFGWVGFFPQTAVYQGGASED